MRALLHLHLVDELRLFVFPVVVGHGAQLLDGAPGTSLELIEARPFASGAVLLRYAIGDAR